MDFRLYYNITKNGNHFGCQYDSEIKYIREIDRGKIADLIAYAEVILLDEIEINYNNIFNVVEECFTKINNIEDKKQYHKKSNKGELKLLTDKELLDDVNKVKKIFIEAIENLKKHGIVIVRGKK